VLEFDDCLDPGKADTVTVKTSETADYAPGVIATANSGPDSGGQFFFLSRGAATRVIRGSSATAQAATWCSAGQPRDSMCSRLFRI